MDSDEKSSNHGVKNSDEIFSIKHEVKAKKIKIPNNYLLKNVILLCNKRKLSNLFQHYVVIISTTLVIVIGLIIWWYRTIRYLSLLLLYMIVVQVLNIN